MTSRLLLSAVLALLAACLAGCASTRGRQAGGISGSSADTVTATSRAADSPQPGALNATPSAGSAGSLPGTAPGGGPGTVAPGSAKAPDASGRPTPAGAASADTAGRSADSAKNPATPVKPSPGAKDPRVKVTGPAPSPAPPRAEPLVMENADRMEGFRSRGEYILSGKVRFSHGDLRLETERAVWQKDRSLVYAEAGMRIVHRGAVLTSDRGSYDKNQGRATAEGKVHMRDSTGEVEASGHNVTYERFKHLATLTGQPEVRRYYRKQPDSGVAARTGEVPASKTAASKLSQGKASKDARALAARTGTASRSGYVPGPKPPEIIDTLVIRGKILTFNDSSGVAAADGDVRITRKQVLITCKQAQFHDRKDSLYLMGDPQVKLDESLVKGLAMRVGMTGEEIKSLLVKGEAQAKSIEPATDTSSSRQSDIRGDSLFMAFREKAIDSVQVFRNAKGSYFDVDRPDYVNRMSGEYMVLRFNEKKIRSANVLGGAKSTYFHLEKKAFKGKNDAEGDTIDFAFKDGKVEEVLVRGRAKGTYFGEPQTRKHLSEGKPLPGGSDSTGKADTTGAPTANPGAKAPPLPAQVPAVKPAPAPPPAPKTAEPRREEVDRSQLPNIPWRKK